MTCIKNDLLDRLLNKRYTLPNRDAKLNGMRFAFDQQS